MIDRRARSTTGGLPSVHEVITIAAEDRRACIRDVRSSQTKSQMIPATGNSGR